MYEKIKKIMIMVILTCIIFVLFSTFANFVIEHQKLMARLERDNTVISEWRAMVSKNIKTLSSDHHERCDVLPNLDPQRQE